MALFHVIAELAEALAGEPGRLKKRAAIAEAIAAAHAAAPKTEDAGLFALYLAGTPFAEADPRRLNAGGALLSKALLSVSGATSTALTAAYKRHGDLGAAAFDLLQGNSSQKASLTLQDVAEAFAAMAAAKTTAIRAALVEGLLQRSTALEAKYLLKLMSGDMRIGVKQSLVEEAIAVAASAPVAEVRHAVMLEADLAAAVRRAFAGTLGEARMRLFHPLGFMLASPVDSPEEAVERFAGKQDAETASIEAFLEDKYDGMRAQIHCGDAGQPGRVVIYSRNRDDVTASFPDLEEAFASVREPLIFDGEILGWDLKAARALPFAVLGQRIGRKRVSNEWRQQVPVVFMAFDLMYANGELTLNQPLTERRNRLEVAVERLVEKVRSPLVVDERKNTAQIAMFMQPDSDGNNDEVERLMLSPARLVQSAEDIERAYADARARANEGVMLKAAASEYQPGRRGLAWVKLKRELATLDVVVTGAELGHGKRAGILSDYTFAVRGPGGELRNVGKAYSGLTDAEIAKMSAWMMEHTLEDQGYFRTVEPLMVLEVAFNNIMRSDRHASGFALRFPRIIRIRTDKPVSEIDTVERVEEIYQSQVDKPEE
ncbi:ATP-dependent DNA ligase [Edaphobacter dinghuensis]|uniref:DNA ligase n=1 Tax=Edaphobacter dinghuensis TaxID=1560005 RepID=A0A917H2Q4_9BACT|nr:ATP-dependent DNA ligase [Edaphobacter dinghuensis]GGG65355.1 DNA ligase [Edaphobacter dinghuensis]